MKKILIIEDDNNILEMLDWALNRHGYDVKIAHDGVEGMEILKSDFSFNLVITDIRMPRADGNQVAKFIREKENEQKIPIIAISGYPSEVQREFFDSVVPKPFKVKNLIESVSSII